MSLISVTYCRAELKALASLCILSLLSLPPADFYSSLVFPKTEQEEAA